VLGHSWSRTPDTYKPLTENPPRSVWTNYTDEIMNAAMKVLSGSLSGQSVRLSRKLLIGRAEDCDLRLESDFVSNYHCILLLDEYTLQLRDLGSKNGTHVNGCRVGTSAIILLHNDTMSIGEVTLLIDLTPEAPESIGSPTKVGSSSTRSDGAVLFDGDRIRADGAVIIPPTVSRQDLTSASPPAPDPVDPPQQREDGNG
jgi:pSer/pThr/pTyr-binding forkhead associated (FHA) protein